jgi:hypothetical protein
MVDGDVSVKTGKGAEARGEGVSTKAGWQAKVKRETRIVIHKRRAKSCILASFFHGL